MTGFTFGVKAEWT